MTTGQGFLSYNMYAYCGNNPVIYVDYSGNCHGYPDNPNLDSPYSGVAYGYMCGSYGAHVRRPKPIPVPDNPTFVGDGHSSDGDLTPDQMYENAEIVYDTLILKGWSHNAICAVLGNMQHESYTINPGRWQDGGGPGYGIVQWDPATKYLSWAAENGYADDSLIGQLEFLNISMQPGYGEWLQNPYCYMTYKQFISSNESVDYLTKVFMHCYERPGDWQTSKRIRYANDWAKYFGGG